MDVVITVGKVRAPNAGRPLGFRKTFSRKHEISQKLAHLLKTFVFAEGQKSKICKKPLEM
jgi:hypothetical protein